jgi:hypothetical protein
MGIYLLNQVDSFLFANTFRFQQNNDIISINSSIYELHVDGGYNMELDKGVLHQLVFGRLGSLFLYAVSIKSFQIDHLKNQLGYISFFLNSLGNFYHQIGLEWINKLCNDSTVYLISLYTNYTYPDRDFCIFAQFPISHGIQLYLNGLDLKELHYKGPNISTLTYAWLCMNGAMTVNIGGINPFPCNHLNLDRNRLNTMLKLCKLNMNDTDGNQQKNLNAYPAYPEYYQTRLFGMLFFELVPFVLIPSTCLIGFFLNWKIVRTIQENKKKELKEDFYKYMSANAKFNCLYCFILVFYPITSCNWKPSYYFCSSIFTSQYVQYYKIVMVAYFEEVIKMCANISYLMMTLNRYLLVGKDHAPWLVKTAKLEFKWVIRGSMLFSVLINIGHGWQYQAVSDLALGLLKENNGAYISQYTEYNNQYTALNGDSFSDYPKANQGQAYFIYSIVYFVINFGLFFILNTGLEVKIVRRMHKELREKRERLAKMNENKLSNTTLTAPSKASKTDEEKKKEDEDGKKERKVIQMVVINGILNFILRAPDVLFFMQNENVWSSVYKSQLYLRKKLRFLGAWNPNEYLPGILSFIVDIGYFTYFLSFSANFIIFYYFNTKFKEAVVFWASSKKN